jgi:ankyrin repeat protein
MVKLLLEAGANPNQFEKCEDGETALMWAVINDDTDLALHLLSAGADPRPVSRYGQDARSIALEKGHTRVVAEIDKVLAN